MLPLDSASSNHSDHSAYTQSERDGRCARLPRGMPVGQRVHLHFPGTMATMATMAAMAWVSYISMAFLSSFCSQFLSSVPREIITVYYGPMPQDLRRLARFPDVFSSIFVNLSAKRSHCTYQGTLGYIWARFKEKTQNCPVRKSFCKKITLHLPGHTWIHLGPIQREDTELSCSKMFSRRNRTESNKAL